MGFFGDIGRAITSIVKARKGTKENLKDINTRAKYAKENLEFINRRIQDEVNDGEKNPYKALKKQQKLNTISQKSAEDARQRALEQLRKDREEYIRLYNIKQYKMVLNMQKSLLALNQKFSSLKSATTISDEDKTAITKLFQNVQTKMGTIPTIKPLTDDFARLILSMNNILKPEDMSSGNMAVLAELSNGALNSLKKIKPKIKDMAYVASDIA